MIEPQQRGHTMTTLTITLNLDNDAFQEENQSDAILWILNNYGYRISSLNKTHPQTTLLDIYGNKVGTALIT